MQTEKIRNILFLGHQGSGKTTLAESLASLVLKTPKGAIENKNTISDYTDEEKTRMSSCSLSVLSVEYKDYKLNLIDAPGNDDFVFDIIGVLDMVKGAVLVIDAAKKIEVGTIKHYNLLKKHGIPTFIFVNKLDKELIDFDALLEEIKEKLGKTAVSFVYPIGHQDAFDGFINVVTLKARKYNGTTCIDDVIHDDKKEKIMSLHNIIAEQVALTDEALLEKFFGGETLTMDEIRTGLHDAVATGDLTPVLVGSAKKDIGIETMLDMMIDYLLNPSELRPYTAHDLSGNEIIRHTVSSEPFSAYVFKTTFDQYKGAVNIVKICSGTLNLGDTILCPNTQTTMKVSQMFSLLGSKQTPITSACAGDIIGLSKLDGVLTGHTLCDKSSPLIYPKAKYPTSVYYRAIAAKNAKDDEKLFASLAKIQIEEPCLDVMHNIETKQVLIGGLSDSHLAYILEKVKNIFGVVVDVDVPKIKYRETVRKEATAPGRYIKQSGGSGFYGVVEMKFGPSGSEENVFEETVFGGAVPKSYFPAVEKGFVESTEHGLLAGFPVIGLKATLLDGKYHPVDSNELAFKMASILAFKEAYMNCNPTILEPIMKISIHVPNEFTGNIMNDLNKSRARVLSIDEKDRGIQAITALVPEAEILEYAIRLRVLSQGSGFFLREFASYQEVPSSLVDNIIKQYGSQK